MWPYICQFVEKLLRETVEPAIKETNSHLSTFCFSKIDIGEKVSTPPSLCLLLKATVCCYSAEKTDYWQQVGQLAGEGMRVCGSGTCVRAADICARCVNSFRAGPREGSTSCLPCGRLWSAECLCCAGGLQRCSGRNVSCVLCCSPSGSTGSRFIQKMWIRGRSLWTCRSGEPNRIFHVQCCFHTFLLIVSFEHTKPDMKYYISCDSFYSTFLCSTIHHPHRPPYDLSWARFRCDMLRDDHSDTTKEKRTPEGSKWLLWDVTVIYHLSLSLSRNYRATGSKKERIQCCMILALKRKHCGKRW